MSESPLSVSTMLRAMLEAGAAVVHVGMGESADGHHPMYHVRAVLPDSEVHGEATSLGRAMANAYHAVMEGVVITPGHAKDRARVRLPEGGLGTLTHVNMRQRVGTVHTDEGRWRHLPLVSLQLFDATEGARHG